MSFSIPDPRQWLTFVPATLSASPLYSELWRHLRNDQDILGLLALIESNQPLPVTFFTAVNFLVLAEPQHPLARFYPILQTHTLPPSEAYPCFRAFVREHREALEALLPTARLQTNEVTRCANLLPAFTLAYEHGGYQPLHMIEMGCSAGLNLLWPHYGYHYGCDFATVDLRSGEQSAPVQISCELAGTRFPPVPDAVDTPFPQVARCQGIELCPRDLGKEEDVRWLRAAIWPEERERYRLLDAALAFARSMPLPVQQGDACDLLPDLLAAIPDDQTAVVWHSFAVEQGPVAVKIRLDQQIADASRRIPIYRVALEFTPHAPLPQLELAVYREGKIRTHTILAQCAIHGEHMTWLAETF